MPGVLQIESLIQAAASLMNVSGAEGRYRLTRVADVKFGQFVRPEDLLRLTARLVGNDGKNARFEGRIDRIEDGRPAGRVVSAEYEIAPLS